MKRYSNFSKIISHQSVNEETDARRKQDPPSKEKNRLVGAKTSFWRCNARVMHAKKQTPWSGTVYTLHSRGGRRKERKREKKKKEKGEKRRKKKNCHSNRLRLSFASPTIMRRPHAHSHRILKDTLNTGCPFYPNKMRYQEKKIYFWLFDIGFPPLIP